MIFFLKKSIALKVRAQPFTEEPEYGPLNIHLGVQEEGLDK